MPEKKFEKAREKELGLQKKSLERLEVSAIGNLKKLILFIMLDEIDVYADILGKKISSSEKYRVLFGKRIEHCEKFLELSSGDDLTLEETAHRYKTYCELVISKETRNRIGSGLKTAALVIGAGTTAFLTLKSVMGKVREKKKEHK